MMRSAIVSVLTVIAIGASACDYTYQFQAPNSPTTVPTTTPARDDVIEFRVEGDLPSVTIRVNNGIDGLTQTTTVLPFTSQVRLGAAFDNVFLSIDARATGTGFLHAAIFINGVIFREASAAGVAPVVIASGTYRRAK